MDQELAEICYNELIEGFWIYAISGNHDIKKISKVGTKPFSWLYQVEKYGIMILDYEKPNYLLHIKILWYMGFLILIITWV